MRTMDILRRAAVEILFIGCGDPSAAEKVFSARFAKTQRQPVAYDASLPCVSAKQVRTVREDMDIAQGKLVMASALAKLRRRMKWTP